jgi:hypothetical protein
MARIMHAVLGALRENRGDDQGGHFHPGGIDRPYPCFDVQCARYRRN